MASTGNQNQNQNQNQGVNGPQFDIQTLFNNNPQNPNPNNHHHFPPPPSSAASYPPPTVTAGGGGPYPIFHHQFHLPPPPPQLHSNRSLPYPTSPLQPPNPNPNPNHGARLMALLSSTPDSPLPSPTDTISNPNPNPNPSASASAMAVVVNSGGGMARMASSKVPRGRHLIGDRAVYDIDVRLVGETQPQLEVTPITKYGSDPGLVVGRQIAVNKTYICYGLKPGTIRVLNINTALRSLLKGLAQRVTDMAFFAEDVHVLASASVDGRVYVWKITEGPDEEDKPQITGKIVTAIQIVGEGEPVHPRVCWHCHKQEVLVVGIGKRILRLDTTKIGRGEAYSAEEPLRCSVDKLIDGIQFVGKHDGEVTDLSMCQWMTTRLVSASVDGTIKIWEDRKSSPIAVLRPYDGLPVNSVTFLTAPHRPDHIILITGGPLNREVKIWVSESEEGWLLPSDADSWHCTQTLELKSSAEPRIEDAFFNQVVALSQSGLLLLANAKKNAIYAVHLDYGPNPESTRMDYISEFTVTMPILSFTGTSDALPNGEHIVQVYCVQTQAIQQYALDLSQCLPPPIYDAYQERSEGFSGLETSGGKLDEIGSRPASDGAPIPPEVAISKEIFPPGAETKSVLSPIANDIFPTSPKLSGKVSDFRSPASGFEPRDQINGYGDQKATELERARSNLSSVASVDDDIIRTDESRSDRMVKFKHPTHLVTPAELMATSSAEVSHVIDDVAVISDDVEVKVVDEISQNDDAVRRVELDGSGYEVKEKSFSSQATGLGLDMAQDNRDVAVESYVVNEVKEVDGIVERKVVDEASDGQDGDRDMVADVSGPVEAGVSETVQSVGPTSGGKKQKGKNGQTSSVVKSTDSCEEVGASLSIPSAEAILLQIQSMQETINQVLISQKEIQKQIPVVAAVPITKEGKRIEAVIGKSMEKIHKANSDAYWARTQEEFAKQEKSNRDRLQQVSTLASNGHKDLVAASEKLLKKEMAAAVAGVGRSVTPVIEKAVSTAVLESFQRGVGDKAVSQLEKAVNSKLEATISRQIQAQFQTSGRQALQEALKSSMEAFIIPSFETLCRTMFDQVDATFQKGMVDHTTAAQQQAESVHLPLAFALRDTINSASSLTRTLSNELGDGQRKLMALAVSGASSSTGNSLIRQISNGPLGVFNETIEAPVDPTKELSRLVYEHKYEEAFTAALQRSDVRIVSWLCSQVDLQGLLTRNPLPLSQGVLLSLLQQLACDIGNDTSRKLGWMMDVVVAINPTDGIIAMHVRPIFEQVQSILNHQVSLPTSSVAELSSIRVVMRLVNSMLGSL